MDVWESIKIVVRRWYVTAPLLALTVVVMIVGSGQAQPEYRAVSSLLLVGPNSTLVDDPSGEPVPVFVNPYLSFSGSLPTTALALQRSVGSQQTRRAIAGEGLRSDYAITVGTRSSIMEISARGGDAEAVVATVNRVVEYLEDDLDRRQDDVNAPGTRRISVEVLSQPDSASPNFGARRRVQLSVAAVGLLFTLVAAYALEGLDSLRRRKDAIARYRAEQQDAFDAAELRESVAPPESRFPESLSSLRR